VPLVNRRVLLGALPLLFGAARQGAADEPGVPLFTATYELRWHSLVAGYSTLTLSQVSPGTYDYSSVNRARGLFRLAFPDAIRERSEFRIVHGHVEPLMYEEDNGAGKASQDVHLSFDWSTRRASGTAAGKTVDQPLERGTQDPLSVQVELMRDLIAGEAPTHFLLFDKNSAQEYQYTRERTETLDTPLGRLDTVIYRSDRPDSDRVMRLWLAPSLGYLPVQAERRRKGKVEFELRIRKLQRRGAAAQNPQPPARGGASP